MLRIEVITTESSRKSIRIAGKRGETLVRKLPGFVAAAAELLPSEIAKSEFGPGKAIKAGTGNLWRSIASRVEVSGSTVTAVIGIKKGPTTKYARIQEQGGIIRAKPGRNALAVPLRAARTPGGKRKHKGLDVRAIGKKENLVFIPRKGKPPLLAKVFRVPGSPKGKATRIEPWFILLKKVRIKATRFLSGGVERNFDVFHVSLQRDVDSVFTATA